MLAGVTFRPPLSRIRGDWMPRGTLSGLESVPDWGLLPDGNR